MTILVSSTWKVFSRLQYIYRNIVQYCTWYNHSIRIRYNTHRHTGTCILSSCFISWGAIFSRSAPHGHGDCLVPLSAPCASAQAHSNDNTGRCQGVRPFDPELPLITFALRHWSRIHICTSEGSYRKVSCLGEHNIQRTSSPWVNKQGNYRICL